MVAYQKRQQTIFSTVHSEGAILPMDLLQRISDPQNAQLDGLTPEAYHLSVIKLNEAINRTWTNLLGAWQRFKSEQGRLSAHESGTTLTRERWLLPLFSELGYGRLQPAKALVVGERSYAISHSWQHTPIHLVSYKVDLDRSVHGENGARRSSPHSLLQELLNCSTEHLWGIVSNGLCLRILRNNISLTRQAYVEFDLEAMFNNEIYADFVLLWLLCHQSRVESERPEECWLEKWSREAHASGTRALLDLHKNVEQAISELGSGFLSHQANGQLREKLRTGTLSAMDYYNQLLRMVYRLLVLFVSEDRGILFDPGSLQPARDLYNQYYSTAKLRYQADRQLGTRHSDLYYGLKLIMVKLGLDGGCPELGLPGLNGFLFDPEAVADLKDCQLANYALLAAVRHLAYIESERTRRILDYKNLGSEELGSVYESLLELHPIFHLETGKFELTSASGNERKTTGSYYTPTSLITSLLDSALDPVLAEAANKATAEEAEAAILNLKICDPACGSGHFLVAAAHRVAKRLAAVRTGDEEPAPEARRKALRDVVGHCIYGVDLNPMAVELCKVSLWMEAIEPGKPLSFLDAHIQRGNSLLGTTPTLLKAGIPDEAFKSIEGDDEKICSEFKKKNKAQRAGQLNLFDENMLPWNRLGDLATSMIQMDEMGEYTVKDVRRKQVHYEQLLKSGAYENSKLWADAWCAAFVWKKTQEFSPPLTDGDFRDIEQNPYRVAKQKLDEIKQLADQYQFFHWHLAFPDVFRVPTKGEEAENEQAGWSGGFDVVLGNPPWERIKIQEKEWFASRRPEVANAINAAQRRRMIAALAYDDPDLYTAFMDGQRKATGESHLVRESGRYPLCGRGDMNTYAIFAENMQNVIKPTGRVGCIVPSAIVTGDTTKDYFQYLMKKRTLVSIYDFENSKNIFRGVGHGVFKFGLLTLIGSIGLTSQNPDFVFFVNGTDALKERSRHFVLSEEDVALLNPNTRTCPIFRSQYDADLIKGIYKRIPIFIKEGSRGINLWKIKLFTMFHMTNDAHLFHTREDLEENGWVLKGNYFVKGNEKYLPLYESKLIYQFNHRDATFDDIPPSQRFKQHAGTNDALMTDFCDAGFVTIPRYWVHEREVFPRSNDVEWFLGYRNAISAVADVRSLIASIIPLSGVGNSMPLLKCEMGALSAILLLTTMNSFVLDYIVRQKANGGNLNFYVFNQLPFPPPEEFSQLADWAKDTIADWILPRALELTYTAWDLEPFARDCGYNGPPYRWDDERRFLLRCELDAAYFHLYGIVHDDVDYIMDTFRVWREKEVKQLGEYRTKRVILEIYDEMQRAIETGVAYETHLDPPPADLELAHEPRSGVEV